MIKVKYGVLVLGFCFLSVSEASANCLQQVSGSLAKTLSTCDGTGNQHTINYNGKVLSNPWFTKVQETILKKPNASALKQEVQLLFDQIEALDRCVAAAKEPKRTDLENQFNVAVSVVEQLAVAADKKNAIFSDQESQNKAQACIDTVGPEARVKAADQEAAANFNLKDTLSAVAGMPQSGRSNEVQNPAPARIDGMSNFEFNTGANNAHKLRAEADNSLQPSDSGREGFWQRIKQRLDWTKEAFLPSLHHALTIQTFAASPFSTLGQSGQNQLRVMDSARQVERSEREARRINTKRDIETTRLNDIAGQGKAAAQERVLTALEVMNETTELQESTLKSIEHVCQNQRSEMPCWESGNDLPLDLMFQLMGGNGSTEEVTSDALELAPYTAWLHCPLPDENFTRISEGTRLSALFLDEKERLLLTVKSKLPSQMHADGCIVALQSDEDLQYFAATLEPEITERDNIVAADLALLKINTVHTENGQDLANPEMAFDDFVNEYWPAYQAQCANDPDFKIGDEVQLYGFTELEEEAEAPQVMPPLNGLATYITQDNGVSRFTTNGEETFNGGLVARANNGCFKGLATIKIEDEVNTQKTVPLPLIKAWLQTQNVELPTLN